MPPDPSVLPNWLQILLLPFGTAGWMLAGHMFLKWQEAKKAAQEDSSFDSKLNGFRDSLERQIDQRLEKFEERNEQNWAREDTKRAEIVSKAQTISDVVLGPEKNNGMRSHVQFILDFVEVARVAFDRIGQKTGVDVEDVTTLRRRK